jgi:hypothetical protein
MGVVRINELPEGSGSLSNDDIFLFMDNPSSSGTTRQITLDELRTYIFSSVEIETVNTSLLLKFNDLTDSSINNHAIIVEGSPLLDNSTITFNETPSYLTVNHSGTLDLSGGDWTIELVCRGDVSSSNSMLAQGELGDIENCWSFENNSFYADTNGGIAQIIDFDSIDSLIYNHFAITSYSGTIRGYLNGQYVNGVPGDLSGPITGPVRVGNSWYEDRIRVDGDIKYVRIIKGLALYTDNTNFTPSLEDPSALIISKFKLP